jgi:hypothetical protein
MKKIIIILITSLIGINSTISQKIIKCNSGQIIEATFQGNFISSNANELLKIFVDQDSTWIQQYQFLLNQELINRLNHTKKISELSIIEYESRINKKDSKKLSNEIKSIKNEIRLLDKEYAAISKKITAHVNTKNINTSSKIDTTHKSHINVNINPILKDTVIKDEVNQMDTTLSEKTNLKNEKSKVKIEKENKDNCSILFKGRDEKTKKKLIILNKEEIFTYTPEKMMNYFKLDNYLTTSIGLESLDDNLFLNVELRFNSKDIQKSYGSINKNDFMRIDFITGNQLFLNAVEVEDPFIESYTGNTIYRAKYAVMNKENENYLRKFYVDKIGILWTSGYETYPVYKVDFLKEKMNCLDNAK